MAAEAATAVPLHPEAIPHLPPFITAPGQSDWLMSLVAVFLVLAVVGIGVFYLKLHALPEQMAHRGQKIQFEIVAVLALLALFTHNHLFWIAGLLLALIPFPDLTTPLTSMAASLGRMANARDPQRETPSTEIGIPPPLPSQPDPAEGAGNA